MPNSLKYTVISRMNFKCGWCEKAVEVLDGLGLPYELRVLDLDQLKAAATKASMSSIPIIYLGNDLIGGYDDLATHLKRMDTTSKSC